MLKRLLENFALKAIDWWFRVKSIERFMIGGSLALITSVYAGPRLIEVILRAALGAVPEGFLRAQRTLDLVDGWILAICTVLLLVGVGLAVSRYRSDAKVRSKKRNVVIEARGLRDDDGNPLADAVANDHEGAVTPIILDLRNRLDGQVIKPENAIADIAAAHRSVLQHKKDGDRASITTIYGGLTSVPYTFLTGVLLDDEGEILTYDWDRAQEAWRKIDGEDDGISFSVDDFRSVTEAEVVVALGFSYPVTDDDLATTFNLPIVRLTLESMSSDAHWSQKKQRRLGQEFFEAAKRLSANGVKRIHLVLAAPNSVVFTFGRRYDKRNLPELVVYQYQRGEVPAYPWGVLMPVAGIERPRVLYSEAVGSL
ncbi:SAVED domain-containing protein [Tepidamorphus sp. 3E244]|uniref:SAVED domain-containing protein n=1 Tax=Tepidamorphus sp. 3E244 TaxID=3385498 RepID=UPI0038FC37EF